MKALFRVADPAPARVHGLALPAGGLLNADPDAVRYEVDLGHLVPTAIGEEGQPLVGLTDAERDALPPLAPLGDGPVEYAVGASEVRAGEGTGSEMIAVPMEPDGEGGFAGSLVEPPADAPEA